MKRYYSNRARLRTLLAFGYTVFIAYASLSPFTDWQNQGLDFIEVLASPFWQTYTAFDATINLLSYLPFGLLLALMFRMRHSAASSALLATALCAALSVSMEFLQMYLPTRTSSNLDMLTNTAGGLAGATLAVLLLHKTRVIEHLKAGRSRLFNHGHAMDFGLALLALWMFGQVNPSRPMLGSVFISEVARQPFAEAVSVPFNIWVSATVMLNLAMLGVLLYSVLRDPRGLTGVLLAVVGMVALVKFIAAAVLLKSWAMLLWINSEAALGIVCGLLLVSVSRRLPREWVLACGAIAALLYVLIVNFVLDNLSPSDARSIYHWHYGHLLNYNGIAQTITLAFPWLLWVHVWRTRKV